jgi:hypothetical protein
MIPTPQPTPDLYTQATSGKLLFNDPLSQNGAPATWAAGTNVTGACTFAWGSYHALTLAPNPAVPDSNIYSIQPAFCPRLALLPRSNFSYQAQMTILKGDGGGLFFGFSIVNHLPYDYLFSVDQSGSFTLTVMVPTGSKSSQVPIGELKTLIHRPSNAIKTGLTQPNLLTVIVQGNNISLYINRQSVAQVHAVGPISGYFGVIAWATPHPTDAAFNNAQMWL